MRALVIATLVVLSGCVFGCEGRPRDTSLDDEQVATNAEAHVAELDLRNGVAEQTSGGLFSGKADNSFSDLLLTLRNMQKEPNIKGVYVRLESSIGVARGDEIARHLEKLRDQAIPILCHAHGYDNSTMLLAARACDEIWVSPAGNVDTVGIAAQLLFGRALLDRLHVKVDFLRAGKFKSAVEPFTRNSSSPEAREALQSTLGAIRDDWLEGIAKGRGKSAAELAVEDGPYTAEAGKEIGLIDEVGYERDARARILERAGAEGFVGYFGRNTKDPDALAGIVHALSGSSGSNVPHIALLRATGGITMQSAGGLFGGGEGITEAELGKQIRKLIKDESVKAVVLRIDSPGGSALASDLLWKYLMELRDKKPLVASVGSMAASGGYYLACASTKIVAERASIVGSIGVLGGKLSFRESLGELGIHVETVAARPDDDGNRASMDSPFSEWNDATRAKVQTSIDATYDLFLSRVAEGRAMDKEKVREVAEGRIMAGQAGVDAGLVDELDGLGRAIDLAIELAGVEADIPIDIVESERGLLAMLADPSARAQLEAEMRLHAEEEVREALTGALLPYRTEILDFATSAAPLIQGERVIAALPFVIAVR